MPEARTSPESPADPSPREVLLRTKLYRRGPPPSLVPRPRLIERLNQGLSSRLVLVSAPAGFGKTTLLSEWLDRCPCAVAWVSLDPGDDDPSTFLRYVVAALQTAAPEVGRSVEALLRSSQVPSLEPILTVLLNDLASLPQDLVLVFEDYHSIANSAIHSGIVYLLDHLPPTVHLVIATRADPSLPLARLRSRGELVEVRADDLRFEQTEAKALVEGTAEISLSPEESAALQTKTEGWAAGLQLAALSLRGRRGREDISRFVADFAGSNRYVADYLLEEVLGGQQEPVQTFLLETSILDRLSGSLVDAVTGRADGQAMLERLELENLFLVPLDEDRRWYRYHHLFADLLRVRLRQTRPGVAPELCVRAARWSEREGLTADAFGYYLAANDFDQAARLAEEAFLAMWARSEFGGFRVTELPDAAVRRRPWLSSYRATLLVTRGQLAEAEGYVQAAEEVLHADEAVPDARDLTSYLAAIRAYVAEWKGQDRRAVETAREALSVIGEDKPTVRNTVGYWLGISLYVRGDLKAAEEVLTELARHDRQTAVTNIISPALSKVVKLQIEQGRLREAARLSEEWLSWMDQSGRWRYYLPGNLSIMLAEVLRQWNDLDSAERRVREGIEDNRAWAIPHFTATGYCTLARVLMARGDLEGAEDALRQLEPLIRGQTLIPDVQSELVACRVSLALARDDLASALRTAVENGLADGLPCDFRRELDRLTLARVLIAHREYERALSLIDEQERQMRDGRRFGRLIEILVLQAKALESGDTRAHELALGALGEALSLAEPEGFVRVFVDEGEPIARLLADLRRSALLAQSGHVSPSYVAQLLSAFDSSERRASAGTSVSPPLVLTPQRSPIPAEPLIEPLSEREREVLALIADGLTNEQIASRLIIAVGTVKAHIHNISGKLGAQNRARAVARAKELGLL